MEYLTTRCGLGTVTALQYVMTLTLQAARQWKKSLGRLRRENRELKRANGILKTASAFFAAEPGRPTTK
ncbi:transposase [Corynebacterium striatum]|nr:transposase [Corynebacterium striatum]